MTESANASDQVGFKLVWKPLPLVLGALGGMSLLILLQQYGVTLFTMGKLFAFAIGGLLVALLLASFGAMAGAKRQKPSTASETPAGGNP